MSRIFPAVLLSSLLLTIACSPPPGEGPEGIDRGPRILEVDGDPNGLWWDDAEQALYVADDNGNRILKWTDADGFVLERELPEAPEKGAGLGQLVRMDDGTLVVTRFGHGSAGAVVFVPPTGDAKLVPDLDLERRRIGLTVTPDGTIFDSWFVRLSGGERVGAVGRLSLSGTEEEVITGLKKPVGVLAMGDSLYISDQDLKQVLKAPLNAPAEFSVFAAIPSPDHLAAGPDGSLFVGSEEGNLFRIEADGAASVIKTGFDTVRGVAFDPTNRRLFVVNHVGHEAEGVVHSIHMLPME